MKARGWRMTLLISKWLNWRWTRSTKHLLRVPIKQEVELGMVCCFAFTWRPRADQEQHTTSWSRLSSSSCSTWLESQTSIACISSSACCCWMILNPPPAVLPPSLPLSLHPSSFQPRPTDFAHSFIHVREARRVSLASVSPPMPVTASNKNKARDWTRPWQRMEAAGFVAGLFWLAAHALYDPEDYWLKASRAKCVFPSFFPCSNLTCKQNQRGFSMKCWASACPAVSPLTDRWCGFFCRLSLGLHPIM